MTVFFLVQQHITTRELINEANSAQLVVQHLHLDELNCGLHEKENKAEDDHTWLFPDVKGHVLTSDEFVEEVTKEDEKKHGKEGDKKTQAAQRVEKKAAMDGIEMRWREMKTKHEERVQEWVAEYERFKVKELPSAIYQKSQHGHCVHILRRACQ